MTRQHNKERMGPHYDPNRGHGRTTHMLRTVHTAMEATGHPALVIAASQQHARVLEGRWRELFPDATAPRFTGPDPLTLSGLDPATIVEADHFALETVRDREWWDALALWRMTQQ